MLISLTISGFPFAFLLILSYITGIDPVLARAAATLGADRAAQFRYIYLPLLAPGLAMCFCLAFVQAFSVFPSAVLLGAPAFTGIVVFFRHETGTVASLLRKLREAYTSRLQPLSNDLILLLAKPRVVTLSAPAKICDRRF